MDVPCLSCKPACKSEIQQQTLWPSNYTQQIYEHTLQESLFRGDFQN
jgi:hypothetical protein